MTPTRTPLRTLALLLVGAFCLIATPLTAAIAVSGDDLDLPDQKGNDCKPQDYGGGSGTLTYEGREYFIYGGWTDGCKGGGCDDSVAGSVYDTRGNYIGPFLVREHRVKWENAWLCYTECNFFGNPSDQPGHVKPSFSQGTGYVDFECYKVATGNMCGGSKTVSDLSVFIARSSPV